MSITVEYIEFTFQVVQKKKEKLVSWSDNSAPTVQFLSKTHSCRLPFRLFFPHWEGSLHEAGFNPVLWFYLTYRVSCLKLWQALLLKLWIHAYQHIFKNNKIEVFKGIHPW